MSFDDVSRSQDSLSFRKLLKRFQVDEIDHPLVTKCPNIVLIQILQIKSSKTTIPAFAICMHVYFKFTIPCSLTHRFLQSSRSLIPIRSRLGKHKPAIETFIHPCLCHYRPFCLVNTAFFPVTTSCSNFSLPRLFYTRSGGK